MRLRGQDGDGGYAMAALLVALAVMSILMMAALPAWRHQARREKEAELAFRGEQWARAVGMYQRKTGTFPPSLDVLVQGRYIRKKYKDPFTEDGEFMPRYAGVNPQPGNAQPGSPQRGQSGGPTNPPSGGRGIQPPMSPGGFPGGQGQPGGFAGGQGQPGGVIGVISKSREASVRVYKGATRYNEWNFTFANMSGAPGGGGRGAPGIGRGRGNDTPGPFPGRSGFPGRGGDGRGFPGPGGRGIGPGRGGPGMPNPGIRGRGPGL